MEAISYSNLRQNLRSVMRRINDDAEKVVVTTNDNSNVVMMAETEYNSMMETLYLLRSPINHAHLMEGIAQFEQGKGKIKELPDL